MNDTLYFDTVEKMTNDPRLLQMKKYRQHGSSNTYDHSIHVAVAAFNLAKILKIEVDEVQMARGAMLHDFYLYDIGDMNPWVHGTGHAEKALENSEKYFQLGEKERDIIFSHMWPLNITHIPHYKESVLIGIADKYAAVSERFHVGSSFMTEMRGAE